MRIEGLITILGSGASAGVPIIGCNCKTCISSDFKDHRLRSSILIEIDQKKIVVDTSPDFRFQALREKIHQLDGIILTHMHFDHIAGIDDTRVYLFHDKDPIPFLLTREAFDDFYLKYAYFFQTHGAMTAKVSPKILENEINHETFLGLDFSLVYYKQGKMQVLGFKLGDFAYITDIKDWNEAIYEVLKGVKTLVISALKETSTPYHLSFDEAIQFANKIGAKKTYLTHLSHDVNYAETQSKLPQDIYLAYDGLKITFNYERKIN